MSQTALRLRLRTALVSAMKTRDSTAIAALRSALGAIDNAEAVDLSQAPGPDGGVIAGGVAGLRAGEVPRRALSEQRIAEIVRAEVTARHSAATEYDRLGRHEDAVSLRAQADVLFTHLNAG